MAQTRRRTGRIALLVAVGLLLGLGVAAFGAVAYVQHRVNAGLERFADPFAALPSRPPVAQQPEVGAGAGADPAGAAPVTVLILGSDSRISAGDPAQWRAGAQRTDAIMLAQVSGDRQTVAVMSIPRDSWVEVPGRGMAKINAAYSYGGPTLLIQAVEQLTGIRIDHVVVADFESFATLTDELGGVEVALPEGLDHAGEVLPPGTHRLNGAQALAYARDRYSVPGGDFGRIQRQQNWVRALLGEALTQDVLTDPARMLGLIETMSRAVAVDEGFTTAAMAELAWSARSVRAGDVAFITAPAVGTGWSPDGRQSIVILNTDALAELSAAFVEDRVAAYLELEPASVPVLGAWVP